MGLLAWFRRDRLATAVHACSLITTAHHQPLLPSVQFIDGISISKSCLGVAVHARGFAVPASTAGTDDQAPGGTSALSGINDEDIKAQEAVFLQAVLSRLLPGEDFQEVYRTTGDPRLRIADLPATSQLMDSFAGDKLPGDPVYDPAIWLQRNYPQMDARPRSGYYHWQTWAREHLPVTQQRALLTMDRSMQDEEASANIIRRAQFELARLWDWQHHRVALGLSHDLQPGEREVRIANSKDATTSGSSSSSSSSNGSSSEPVQHEVGSHDVSADVTSAGSSAGIWQAIAAQRAGHHTPAAASVPTTRADPPHSAAAAATAAAATAAAAAPLSRASSTADDAGSGILSILSRATSKPQEKPVLMVGNVKLTPEYVAYVMRVQRQWGSVDLLDPANADKLAAALKPHKYEYNERQSQGRYLLSKAQELTEALRPDAEPRADVVKALQAEGVKNADILQRLRARAFPKAKPLAPLSLPDLREEVKGAKHWGDAPLINQSIAIAKAASSVEAAKERHAARKLQSDARQQQAASSSSSGEAESYVFSSTTRPSTPTLSKLMDYLQVKYADVLLQKDATHHLLMSMHLADSRHGAPVTHSELLRTTPAASSSALHHAAATASSSTATTASAPSAPSSSSSPATAAAATVQGSGRGALRRSVGDLSVAEVDELNRQADAAFARSPAEYSQLLRQLMTEGLVAQGEADNLLAACARAHQERLDLGNTSSSLADSTAIDAPASDTPVALDAATASTSSQQQQQQQQQHDAAGVSSAERSALLGVLRGRTQVASALQFAPSATAASASATARARTVWDEAVAGAHDEDHGVASFDAWAKALEPHIEQQVAASGIDSSSKQAQELLSWWRHAPTFDEAQEAWREYLQAAGHAAVAGPTLGEVLCAAHPQEPGSSSTDAGDGAALPAALVARRLAAIYDAFAARGGRVGGSDGTGAEASPALAAPPSWEALQRQHQALDVDDPASLQAAFQSPSMQDVLRARWQQLSEQFQLDDTLADTTLSWDRFYELMNKVAQKHLPKEQQAEDAAYPHTGLSPAALVLSSEEAAASAAGRSPSGSSTPVHAAGRPQDGLLAGVPPAPPPPYSGARQIVRFSQNVVLHASSAFSPHPAEARVVLRVHAAELQHESGLTDAALQHMLRVCGPRRYSPATGDITILGLRYPSREENRRWCLERLHRLVEEGHRRHPTPDGATYLFSRLPSPFTGVAASVAAE